MQYHTTIEDEFCNNIWKYDIHDKHWVEGILFQFKYYGMPKRKKIQDIENHTNTTILNQENNIFNPRLLYITARNYIHVQDVVNTCVKMEIYMQE